LSTIPEIDISTISPRELEVINIKAKHALKKHALPEGEKNFLLSICTRTNLSKTLDIIKTGQTIKIKMKYL